MKLIEIFDVRRAIRRTGDKRPCAVCGLAPKIRLDGDYGRVCLFYGVRILPEEENDTNKGMRAYCMKDGNNFVWPVLGLNHKDLLDWSIHRNDWYLKRTALKVGAVVGVLGVVLTAIGIAVSMWPN